MAIDPSTKDIDDIDWNSEDDQDIQDTTGGRNATSNEEASSSSTPCSKLIQNFVGMGFPRELVAKAIEQNGEDSELILETLLTYSVLENSLSENPCAISPQHKPGFNSDESSSGYNENFLDDLSDTYSWSEDDEENADSLSDKERRLLDLTNMGYPMEEASLAMDRCGPEATVAELIDFISAAQVAKSESFYWQEDDIKPKLKNPSNANDRHKRRKLYNYELQRKKRQTGVFDEDNQPLRLPKPMVGFGVPTETCPTFQGRTLSSEATGPPYFYYENVALAPKGVWETMTRHLFDVEPEFVDSLYFSAAARKRGYIHNLPIENRFPLLPLSPRTIHEALPLTRRWWPAWDYRTKLNCIQSAVGSAKLTERIRNALEDTVGEPPLAVQNYVLEECRRWNLVWVGLNKVAPLEPDEVEMLLGFPKSHTRGISRTDRYKALGNSFQVDTVAYHLSVLKELYPKGINVLSLFSGIGGAEVALHRLGIHLKNVVSVEKSEVSRTVMRSWWEQSNQTGNLIEYGDIEGLERDEIKRVMASVGGFDLVIGGSPCNNLSGSNRVSRDGLEGKESSLFFEYVRVLNVVKDRL
ncbi:DNA (cytosine-5)-methyltransferase DRM2-like [Ipomoea triloba]|uniref:DNA (cytosine-5)-methyltransferase DRM2-like n=1 Tax=Ipomoea triloba TaxID=35885 RepID=UPI00125E26E2|nr:DNA (cytosine-5)-methyltransferase DRM2-like [Ipomoea triloba]XP_031096167.1 DNA (cytosine-5)-methyltransferase DRM2-like [Ipomoea triloba]